MIRIATNNSKLEIFHVRIYPLYLVELYLHHYGRTMVSLARVYSYSIYNKRSIQTRVDVRYEIEKTQEAPPNVHLSSRREGSGGPEAHRHTQHTCTLVCRKSLPCCMMMHVASSLLRLINIITIIIRNRLLIPTQSTPAATQPLCRGLWACAGTQLSPFLASLPIARRLSSPLTTSPVFDAVCTCTQNQPCSRTMRLNASRASASE